MIMQRRRCIILLSKGLMCIATFSLLITVCKGGELSESDSLFKFIRAVDPKNILRIEWNGLVPHPCSYQWKGVKCNLQGTTIRAIRLENMNLSGIIDTDSLCKLPNLQVLSLAKNQIQGSIPDSIQNCTSLMYLDLSSNLLNGSVPMALRKLKNLRRIDISNNNFMGTHQHFKYESKHLSDYSMESSALQANGSTWVEDDFAPKNPKTFEKWTTWVLLVLGIACVFLLIYFISTKAAKFLKEKEILTSLAQSPAAKSPPAKDVAEVNLDEGQSELVFFVEEGERFKLDDLLEAAADLQSQGLCSSLYKVQLKSNAFFAVKRLKKLQVSFEEFGETMRKVGNLKHPNIRPLVGYNSTNEEKLLIYRYQRNGSLLTLQENYAEGKREFPWKLRLSIAAGIARGLDFICQRSDSTEIIPHGNIKPSNILLNENEEPLISEYGFSKFLDPKRVSLVNSSGYTAPEKISSEKADVFSFGVILLELLTGKMVEKSGLDLPKWVKSTVREEWTGEVFDKELAEVEIYAFSLLNVSLKCVSHFPENRPTIAEVLEKIEEVVYAQEDLSPSPASSEESNQQDCVVLETWVTPESNF